MCVYYCFLLLVFACLQNCKRIAISYHFETIKKHHDNSKVSKKRYVFRYKIIINIYL
ncbi:hypothetical protein K501DRAFT_2391 [Backusella circina FSU 941]|nr:hypothetical protein K501DRAFT_2391 [Backusella circina FSU 941]